MFELFVTLWRVCAIYAFIVYPVGSIVLRLIGGRRKNDPSAVRNANTNTEDPFVAETPNVKPGKPAAPKRPVGRPRKNPPPDPNAPKRPVGRPRKNPPQRPAIIPADKPTNAQAQWREMQGEWEERQRQAADACDAILAARGMTTTRKEAAITPEEFASLIP